MRRVLVVLAVVSAVAFAAACKKSLTEELPTEPSAAFASPIPQQVVVRPVPIPTATPDQGGGGAPPPSNPQPANPTTPVTAPTVRPTTPPSSGPTPRPTTAPTPRPSPGSGGGGGGGGSTVARVGAKVFFVECDGNIVPGSEYASTAPIGCRVHFDCTPRDANNQPTTARGTPEWTFNPDHLVSGGGGGNPYTPAVYVLGEGSFSAFVTIDGVRSADVRIRFVP
jgi:hypothetical protein